MFTDQFTKLSFPLLGLVRLPEVSIDLATRHEYRCNLATSNVDFFKQVVWRGYHAHKEAGRFSEWPESVVVERLRMEFSVFIATGIIDYLLLVWNFIDWCDKQNIPHGPGRGSVTGSLASYCCGITQVNPLKHSLNFTRFISEARARPKTIDGVLYANGKSMCDIDCDISFSQRSRVVEYLNDRYAGRTAKICNRLELTGKTALKDVLKTYLGYDEGEAMAVTGYIESIFGKVESLDEAVSRHVELREWVAKSPEHAEALRIAQQLSGLTVAKGIHASGIFISHALLDGSVPTELSKTGEIVTCYDMETVAELGVKLDCLALKTVDTVDETCRLAGIKASDIDVNHPSIYAYLASTDLYYGCFQIESGVTKEVVSRLGPRHIDDLAASLAIGRPGSLKFKDDLIKYVKTGYRKLVYPPLDALLAPTGGIIIYQETINEVCQQLYKMSPVDADEVRRSISKKVREDMAKWEPILYKKGDEQGIPREVTTYFWNTCNASADYLFSSNHCYAYTYITAQTVYLKANYPLFFTLSQLRMARHEAATQDCISQIINECLQTGIKVLPPDIMSSDSDFRIEKLPDSGEEAIRFGLSHIRGISDSNMGKLSAFRRAQFASKFEVFDAAKAAGIDIRVLTNLIYSGCLNWKGQSRMRLALEAQTYNLLTETQQRKVKQYAAEFDEDIVAILKALPDKKTATGVPVIQPSQLDTLRRKYKPYWEMYQANAANEDLCCWTFERHLLGYSYTTTLHKVYSTKVQGLLTIEQVNAELAKIRATPPPPPGTKTKKVFHDNVKFVAVVEWTKPGLSRANAEPYLKVGLRDDSDAVTAMLYSEERLNQCRDFNGELPEEGAIVLCTGAPSKDGGLIFLDSILVQPNPVQTKKAKVEKAALAHA